MHIMYNYLLFAYVHVWYSELPCMLIMKTYNMDKYVALLLDLYFYNYNFFNFLGHFCDLYKFS